MAVDNKDLVYLLDPVFQIEGVAGKPVVAGHIEVFHAGTDVKYITWQNFDGTRNPFKIPLNNDGRAVILVEPQRTYDVYIYDSFNNLVCSRLNVRPSCGGDISISGGIYDGIDPIVVNNDVNLISANHVPLGVQDPLYFVQDDEEGCIIGLSGGTVPEGTMNESAFGYQDGQITSYNGSAFSAGNSYEAGSYVDITNNTISVTGVQPAGNYQSAGDYVVHDELSSYATQDWVNNQGFLTAHQDISNKLDTTAFSTVSGDFLTAIPSEYVTENTLQSGLSSKLDSTAFSTVSGNFLTAHQSLEGYATEQWVSAQGYLTAHQSLDGLMSADLLEISDNKITGYNGTAFAGTTVSGDFELSAGSGISIVDYPLEQKTVISVTAQGGNPEVEQAVIDNSATWNTVTSKADVTAIPSLEGYATENWVTSQGYLTAVPAGTMNESALEYDANNKISGYNGSAFAGGGVSGTNVVFVPYYEGANYGYYYSATISGDVVVTTGNYFGDDIYPAATSFSLSSVGANIGNKLDKNKIEDSNTIKIINNHAEVTDKAYRQKGFIDGSAYNVDARGYSVNADFNSDNIAPGSRLYSAIVTVETTASGSHEPSDGWSLVSYENNSAIFTKYYPLNERTDYFYLGNYEGWGDFTNAEASATVYSALELAPLAFKDEIPSTANFYPMNENPSGYLTEHQSLADYQTTAGMTAYQPVGDYYSASNPSGFITGVDLSNYATTAELADKQDITGMTAYLTTGDSAEFMTTAERSDYIPTGVSSEFYTTANTANYISEVPDTYLQNTDLSTEDGKVTAISGIPLSAGGDVPEGVMVESGLEYNAVNEISAYNGSAIAQYGAEKQFIVHDDTLCHLSNSAQYALGCNISALQRLMGIDETVLFSANAGVSAGNLSDDPWNYEKIRFYQTNLQGGACITDIAVTSVYVSTGRTFVIASPRGNNEINWDAIRILMTSANFTVDKAKTTKYTNWTGSVEYQNGNTAALNSISKIIGIGRKS